MKATKQFWGRYIADDDDNINHPEDQNLKTENALTNNRRIARYKIGECDFKILGKLGGTIYFEGKLYKEPEKKSSYNLELVVGRDYSN
ncbi:hypothetical protein L484_019471 [Morus notabilis]|uniref:Uncharacterized protein n=1 Tax=Morus notabilis TaxID=981085 RepID=W9S4Z8_9ROSA|nr:hypothetical protein L484_019471 [Morus notabilis]